MDDGLQPNTDLEQAAVTLSSEDRLVRAAVGAIRRGDENAFRPLVELYHRRIFGLVLMIVRDYSGAEEVTQDAFVRAYRHLNRYDERRPFYPWLATIAVRHAQTWLKSRARIFRREATPLDDSMDHTSPGDDPLTAIITNERRQMLWRLVAALPLGQRTTVILYYRQEMKVNQIAQVLGVTSGTVKTLLFRARQTLRHTTSGDTHTFLAGTREQET